MITLLPKKYRCLALSLATALAAAVGAVPAHAESLSADFTPTSAQRGAGYLASAGSPVLYRASQESGATTEARDDRGDIDPRSAAQLLAVVLAVPAGTQAGSGTSGGSNLSSVVKSPGGTGGNSSSGNQNGQSNGSDPGAGTSPEPASLGLALMGSALAGLLHWRRRRQQAT
jgi:hypothetical protein